MQAEVPGCSVAEERGLVMGWSHLRFNAGCGAEAEGPSKGSLEVREGDRGTELAYASVL